MATPDISGNPFYTLMTDPTKGDRDKHDVLVKELILMNPTTKTQYGAFRDFLRGKQGVIDKGITAAKDREFEMVKELGLPTPDTAKIGKMSDKQAEDLTQLKRANGQIEDILSTMFSAEGAAASDKTPSTETGGLYFEVQAQDRSIDNLVDSNGNTRGELQKLAKQGLGGASANDNAPAPVAQLPGLTPVVNRVFDPAQFGKLSSAVVAPEKAQFRKRTPAAPE